MNEYAIHYGLTRRLLHLYAFFCVLATLILICIGGVVTSTGSGLAVPDWPTSYGYNMFLFPFSRWFGDRAIFYEHTHRVVASGVGFLMIGLCAWLWMSHERRERPWLCWAGTAALVLVIIQGILGGLRVTELNNILGLVHGCLAQAFLILVAAITLFLSRTWIQWGHSRILHRFASVSTLEKIRSLAKYGLVLTFAIFVQLILGASMRHQHNGLAVPDFPLAYGQVWAGTSEEALDGINLSRAENHMAPVTPAQIHLHMTHRTLAYFIALAVIIYAIKIWKTGKASGATKLTAALLTVTVLAQFALGAWTVLSNKAADIATAHVFGGAVLLLEISMVTLFFMRFGYGASTTDSLSGESSSTHHNFQPAGQNV